MRSGSNAGSKRVAVITGAAGGIGNATARCFQQAGWMVVGLDRQSLTSLEGADDYLEVDLADAEAVQGAIAQIQQAYPTIHTLVNNAAYQVCKPAVEMAVEEWDTVMSVNVRAAFFLIQGLHPLLKNGQGSIVNVSSVHAIATSANIAAYATSKGAMLAMTRALAIEFAADQIRVNAVLPGAVDTSMLRDGLQRGHLTGNRVEDLLSELGRKTVMGRVGQPHEIAESILFLADNDRSAFMTGQHLVVDGGAIARLSTE